MALQQRKWKAKWVGKRGRAGKNYDQNVLREILKELITIFLKQKQTEKTQMT